MWPEAGRHLAVAGVSPFGVLVVAFGLNGPERIEITAMLTGDVAVGHPIIGIELNREFYEMAVKPIPRLASLIPNGDTNSISVRPHRHSGHTAGGRTG